jgi:hypothetical protein
LPDGRKASATNIYTIVDDNTFTWKSVSREVDGEFLPNVEEFKMLRKTASNSGKDSPKGVERLPVRSAKKQGKNA